MKREMAAALSVMLTMSMLTGCAATSKEDGADTAISIEDDKLDEIIKAGNVAGKLMETQVAASDTRIPTFKVVEKKYSQKYDGDKKFDESDEQSVDYSEGMLYKGTFRYVLMNDECKDDYPLLYEAVNSNAKERMSNMSKRVDYMVEDARQLYEEAVDEGLSFYGPFTDDGFVSVTRVDNAVLSVYQLNEDFQGGAHGMYAAGADNYDVQTGAMLDISDVISSTKEELDDIIRKEISEIAEYENQFSFLEETLSNLKFNPIKDSESEVYESGYNWYFSHDGLHIVFNPYEIGSFGDGMQDIVIGYDEYPGMIRDEYIPQKNAAYCIKENLHFYSDKYDEDNESLHFRYTPADYEVTDGAIVADSFELIKNGKSAKVDAGFWIYNDYQFDIYRVCPGDGREYIYLMVPTESDYYYLSVFDISNGDVKYVDNQSYHYMSEKVDYGFLGEELFVDPYNMHFGEVGDSFGTYICCGQYEIGADGMPVLVSDTYNISWNIGEVHSKVDIKADVIDEAGNILEAGVTIPAGEGFEPIRTDQKSFVDIKLDDGRYIRLTYTVFKHPSSIPEGAVDDIFDDITYAG